MLVDKQAIKVGKPKSGKDATRNEDTCNDRGGSGINALCYIINNTISRK